MSMVIPSRAAPSFSFKGEITEDQRRFFEEYGFIAFRKVFGPDEVEIIREEARELTRRTLRGEIASDKRDDLLPPGTDESGNPYLHRLPYFTHFCERSSFAIQRGNLDSIGFGLLGGEAWRLHDTMGGAIWQLKSGGRGSYSSIDWHLDFPEDHPLVPVVSVGIYLDDSAYENGALVVVPSSHRYPPSRLPPTPLALEARAGDVLCHAHNIFHSSGPSPAGTQRATLYLYYCGGPYPGARLPFAGEESKKGIRALFQPAAGRSEVEHA